MCFECFGILYGLVHSHHLYCLRCPGALETSTISRPWVVSASALFSMVFKFSKPRVFKGFLPIATSAFPPFNGVSRFSKSRQFVIFRYLGSSRVFCLLPFRPLLRLMGFLSFRN